MCSIGCFIYWLYNTLLLENCIAKQYKCVHYNIFAIVEYACYPHTL